MSEKELLEKFLDCLTEKQKQCLSFPMNSQLEMMFSTFKLGVMVGLEA
jgi:hypothetical protein